MNFSEYKDDPAKTAEQRYADHPGIAEEGSHDSPRDISPQSDYYKFVWQDDDDFEAQLGSPGGGYHDYSDQILREIDSELGDLDDQNGQKKGQRPRSRSRRSADRGHVELIQNRKEVGGGARFVSGQDDDNSDEDFQDASDGNTDLWARMDESSNNNYNAEEFNDTFDVDVGYEQRVDRRGKADGQSTENVHRGGGADLNGNLSGSGPRELQHLARDAGNVRQYYHTQIAPVSKDRILLPMEEIEMSYSEDELGDGDEEQAEMPTDEEAIYSPTAEAAEMEDMGIDSDDTRPIVVVDQGTLTQKAQLRTKRLKKAMIAVGTVTAIVAFGLTAYFIVHLLESS